MPLPGQTYNLQQTPRRVREMRVLPVNDAADFVPLVRDAEVVSCLLFLSFIPRAMRAAAATNTGSKALMTA